MATKITPTKFMLKLREDMIQQRDLTDSSANLYMSLLCRMNQSVAFNNLGFLKKRQDEILEFIGQYAPETEKNYLTAAVAALSTVKESHLYKTSFKFYTEKHKELLIKLGEIDPKDKTQAQAENWVSQEFVDSRWDELNEKVNSFKANRSVTKAQFETLVDLLVLSLFVKIAPRRNQDYLSCYIMLRPMKAEEKEPSVKNYLNVQDKEFEFNIYKTAKFYGQQIVPISDELMNVVNTWIKFHPLLQGTGRKPVEVPLFVNHTGTRQSTVNFITLRLHKIFDGKKIGASMLRHIYITDKFGATMDEMEETAEMMGHSIEEQRDYRKV